MKKALTMVSLIAMLAVGCNKNVEAPVTTSDSAITTDAVIVITAEAITTESATTVSQIGE